MLRSGVLVGSLRLAWSLGEDLRTPSVVLRILLSFGSDKSVEGARTTGDCRDVVGCGRTMATLAPSLEASLSSSSLSPGCAKELIGIAGTLGGSGMGGICPHLLALLSRI